MIGVIDSGLGGYTIYRALHQAYPDVAFCFLADQKNAPYGNKQAEDIIRIASLNMQWFLKQGITEVIIACNTMNAVALDTLKQNFPEITFYDVLGPTLTQLAQTDHEHWLVVGTQLTIQSDLYGRNMQTLYPQLQVVSKALPQLVSMIENLASEEALVAYLKDVIGQDLAQHQGLILACTHYPLAESSFRALFKGTIIDSIQAMIERLQSMSLPKGPSRCLTTKDPQFAKLQVQQLFHENQDFEKVEIT